MRKKMRKKKELPNKLDTLRKYLYYPILLLIISGTLALMLDRINKREQIRNNKIKIISDFASSFSDFAQISEANMIFVFERYEIIEDSMMLDSNLYFISLKDRLDCEAALEKKYPITYNLIQEHRLRSPEFSKNLVLAQIYFSEDTNQIIDSLMYYLPVDVCLEKRLHQNNIHKGDLTDDDKNVMIQSIQKEMMDVFSILINQMVSEV